MALENKTLKFSWRFLILSILVGGLCCSSFTSNTISSFESLCFTLFGFGGVLFSLAGQTLLWVYFSVLAVNFLPHFSHCDSSTTLIFSSFLISLSSSFLFSTTSISSLLFVSGITTCPSFFLYILYLF